VSLPAHDFDKGNWKEDVVAFLAYCDDLQVPAYLERSQSGNGAHVGSSLILRFKLRRQETWGLISLPGLMSAVISVLNHTTNVSQSRHHAEGGFGNLIALPCNARLSNPATVCSLTETFALRDQWST